MNVDEFLQFPALGGISQYRINKLQAIDFIIYNSAGREKIKQLLTTIKID